MAVIAAEKPKKIVEPPVLLKIEVPEYPESPSPVISSPSKSISLSPPRTPTPPPPKEATPEPVREITPVKPDTPPPPVVIKKVASPET